MTVGPIIIVLSMAFAAYTLFIGASSQTFNYYGRKLRRSDHPFFFWFSMAVALLVLITGVWMLPLWLASFQ